MLIPASLTTTQFRIRDFVTSTGHVDVECWAFSVFSRYEEMPERNTENRTDGNLRTIIGSLIAAENNIFLCPRVNVAAMRTRELLLFYFGRLPALFFYCQTGVGQL